MDPFCQYTALRIQEKHCKDAGDLYPVDLIYRRMHGTEDQFSVLYTTLFCLPVRGYIHGMQFSTDEHQTSGIDRVRRITVDSRVFRDCCPDIEREIREVLRRIHTYVVEGTLPTTRLHTTLEVAKLLNLQSLQRALRARLGVD